MGCTSTGKESPVQSNDCPVIRGQLGKRLHAHNWA